MSINSYLNEYMQSKGIKQAYLSSKTGISVDAVSRIMRGERKITAEEFLEICFVLEIDPKSCYHTESA